MDCDLPAGNSDTVLGVVTRDGPADQRLGGLPSRPRPGDGRYHNSNAFSYSRILSDRGRSGTVSHVPLSESPDLRRGAGAGGHAVWAPSGLEHARGLYPLLARILLVWIIRFSACETGIR